MKQSQSWILGCVLSACAALLGCGGSGGAASDNALAMTPTQLSGAPSGTNYAATLTASGGSGSGYSWDIESGTFPPGLTGLPAFGTAAVLSGTLGAPGTYSFRVRLRDSSGDSIGVSFSFLIGPAGGGGGGGGAQNRALSLVNAPAGRARHTAVWTGTEMIVWGGFTQVGLLNDGGAYNPATDTWRAISLTGAPIARMFHTAVWSGTEMIIWGGLANGTSLNSGAGYNPATDTWRSLSVGNAPQARVAHSAVWTGTTMIVYGGQGLAPPPNPNAVFMTFNDGAAYDPATDLWAPLAVGQFAQQHPAVWSGTHMMVWGGRTDLAVGFQTTDNGGSYNATTNQWVMTPPSPQSPTARTGHTAVWTDAVGMVVWGGTNNGFQYDNTGGRIHPNTNTWSATSVVNAPSARAGHTAVWTGTEMVVWGGSTAMVYFDDGGVYRPTTNTWRSLSAGFQPSARISHTAVWTGTSMIIWGGGNPSAADAYRNDGAELFP